MLLRWIYMQTGEGLPVYLDVRDVVETGNENPYLIGFYESGVAEPCSDWGELAMLLADCVDVDINRKRLAVAARELRALDLGWMNYERIYFDYEPESFGHSPWIRAFRSPAHVDINRIPKGKNDQFYQLTQFNLVDTLV